MPLFPSLFPQYFSFCFCPDNYLTRNYFCFSGFCLYFFSPLFPYVSPPCCFLSLCVISKLSGASDVRQRTVQTALGAGQNKEPGEWEDWKPDGPCPRDYLYGMAVLELWGMEALLPSSLLGSPGKTLWFEGSLSNLRCHQIVLVWWFSVFCKNKTLPENSFFWNTSSWKQSDKM